MDSQRQQASERIKQSNNILVTVSNNPSVDQLAACIGLTVSLNKMGKHATAVFSGDIPSTLEFLQPEKTIEKNTDSLRDFIIALDKSKADKLRYKVEDRVVKIFITPYRTSISDKDLEFSQGDFNVDVVVALGVHSQDELDMAITSHGRILHDATIVSINTKAGGELGSINWLDPNASSLSELAVQLVNALDKSLIDTQISTAFLTGIVAETERFSNSKTTPQTMSVSAQLMSSGANQQLVATKLEEPVAPPPPPPAPIATQDGHPPEDAPKPVKKSDDGTLEIAHDETKTATEEEALENREEAIRKAREQVEGSESKDEKPEHAETPEPNKDLMPAPDEPAPKPEAQPTAPPPQIHIDEHGSMSPVNDEDFLPPAKHGAPPEISHHNEPPKMILEPPTLGGALTANSTPMAFDSNDAPGLPGMPTEEGSKPASMDEDKPSVAPTIMPPTDEEKNAPGTSFLGDQPLLEDNPAPSHPSFTEEAGKTLSDIERDVNSTHLSLPTSQPQGPASADQPASGSAPTPTVPDIPVVTPTAPAAESFLPPVAAEQPAPAMGPIMPPPAAAGPPAPTPDVNPATVPDMPVTGENPPFSLDSARDAVAQAHAGEAETEPIQALNAQPFNLPAGSDDSGSQFQPVMAEPAQPAPAAAPQFGAEPATQTPAWGTGPTPATPPPLTAEPQYGSTPPAPVYSPSAPAGMPGLQGPSAAPPGPPPMLPPTQ